MARRSNSTVATTSTAAARSGTPDAANAADNGGLLAQVSMGVLDTFFSLLEFLLLLVFCKDGTLYVLYLITDLTADELPRAVLLAVHSFASAVTVWWSMFRIARVEELSVYDYSERVLGLFSTPAGVASASFFTAMRTRWTLSRTAKVVLALNAAGFLVMLSLQAWSGRWLFSLVNYELDDRLAGPDAAETGVRSLELQRRANDPDATADDAAAVTTGLPFHWSLATWAHWMWTRLDVKQAVDMLLLSPLREELFFRGVIFTIWTRRLGDQRPRATALVVGGVFGFVHLLNLIGTKFQPTYIALQIVLGAVIGVFYALRFVLSGSLWESIALHVANNAFSSLLPVDTAIDVWDPLVGLSLLETVTLYVFFAWLSWRQVGAVLAIEARLAAADAAAAAAAVANGKSGKRAPLSTAEAAPADVPAAAAAALPTAATGSSKSTSRGGKNSKKSR